MKLETLKTFCGTDESRPTLLEPWTWKGFTYATDGRVLIQIPAVNYIPERAAEHSAQAQIDGMFSDGSDGDYAPCPRPPECGWGDDCELCGGKGKGDSVKCPCCDTTVEIGQEITCHNCGGRGKILELCCVMVGDCRLNAYYLDKILVLPNISLSLNKSDPRLGHVYLQFDGGRGLLRPMENKSAQ